MDASDKNFKKTKFYTIDSVEAHISCLGGRLQ